MYSSVLGMSLICAITAGPLETVHVQMEKACENRKWQKLRHPDFTDCREKILRGPLKAFIECRAESSCKTYMCILPWVFLFWYSFLSEGSLVLFITPHEFLSQLQILHRDRVTYLTLSLCWTGKDSMFVCEFSSEQVQTEKHVQDLYSQTVFILKVSLKFS